MYELLVTNDRVRQYGIRVGTVQAHNVTCDRAAAGELLRRIEAGLLDETHLFDVVEDWLAER